MLQSKITLVFGKICSGKSTFTDNLCLQTTSKRVTVSDVVKRVSGMTTRSELQQTKDLDTLIAEELIIQIYLHNGPIVIDGIRQYSIVLHLVKEFGIKNIDLIWLEVPDNVRKFRFTNRAIAKDDISFEEADKRDELLGLTELQEKLKDIYTVINN